MSESDHAELAKKWRRRAMIAGVVLALVCRLLPEDYRALCSTVSSACTSTGGI